MFGVIGSYERRVVTGICRRSRLVSPDNLFGVILNWLTIRCGVGDRRGVGVTNKLRCMPVMGAGIFYRSPKHWFRYVIPGTPSHI